jgi:hypothetical protein
VNLLVQIYTCAVLYSSSIWFPLFNTITRYT